MMTYNFKFDDLIQISAKSTNFMFVPCDENQVTKLRVYIKTDKLDKDSTFQSIYTYYITVSQFAQILLEIEKSQSLGKTYNKMVQGQLKRCGFSGHGHRRKGHKEQPSHVSGQFTYRNCIIEAGNFGADNIFERANAYLNAITQKDKKREEYEKQMTYEIDKFIDDLMKE